MRSFEWIDVDGRFRVGFGRCPGPHVAQDLEHWRAFGVERIVSLQTEDECVRIGLTNEEEIARSLDIAFERFAILDHAVPDSEDAAMDVARRTLAHLEAGQGVLFHCFAGVGRSALMCMLTLMLAGYPFSDARRRASVARGFPVPENNLQIRWLRTMEDRLRDPET